MLVGVGGGAVGLIRPARRAVGRFRPVADPARRRGGGAATITGLAIAGSALLASAAGVLTALDVREVTTTENGMAAAGLATTALALGAALIGGTSAYGRRGGVFGTVLAVAAMTLLFRYSAAERWNIAPARGRRRRDRHRAGRDPPDRDLRPAADRRGGGGRGRDLDPQHLGYGPQSTPAPVRPNPTTAGRRRAPEAGPASCRPGTTDEDWGVEERWGSNR